MKKPSADRSAEPLSPFVLLHNLETYVACAWNLQQDVEAGRYWITFFKSHVRTILNLGIAAAVSRGEARESAEARAASCAKEFDLFFDDISARPETHPDVTILAMDQWRDQILRRHGFVDAFVDLKHRENKKMLPLLPLVCARLDAMQAVAQVRAIVEGVFAGNIFDMGAAATAKRFVAGSPDFFATVAALPPRPWLMDDFDRLSDRLLNRSPKKVVFFIDNAGSDFLLGALPMMRWLCQRGASVVLAANERPTLNDMTFADVNEWWPAICDVEPSFSSLSIHRVSTGTGEPLIDLLGVSDALNASAAGADLVILEGMGRGVESNLDARFTCDALNLAMIKDEMVAKRQRGKVYDVVCRFRGAGEA